MLGTIDTLRDISSRCLAAEALTDDQKHWLGASLLNFLNRKTPTLEEAFGLRFPKGGVPWWMEEALRKRDQALRQLAESACGDRSVLSQARHIRRLAIRYAASAWRRDQRESTMPARYRGTPTEFLWRAFKSGAAMPVGERHLRNILGR